MDNSELETAPPEHESPGHDKPVVAPEHVNDQSAAPLDRFFGGAFGESQNGSAVRLLRSPSLSHSANGSVRAIAFKRAQETHGNRFAQRGLTGQFIQRQLDLTGAESNAQDVIPQGTGEPLDGRTRNFMESRFGADFADVRVHTDLSAAQSAETLEADAYTTDRDIYFAAGTYAPEGREGKHLLAHELTHTIQQRANSQLLARRNTTSDVVIDPDESSEREADRAADQVMRMRMPEPVVQGVSPACAVGGPPSSQREGARDPDPLLARGLTLVVQQTSGLGTRLQRKAKAIRFQDEPTLDDVSEGKKVLKEGDKGEAVIRITIALHELGHYIKDVIDQNFDIPVRTAVSKFQDAKTLKGKVPDGQVDKTTFVELDNDFSASYKVERDVLSKQKAPDLLKHTQSIDDVERAATAKAISTEPPVNPVTGLPPTFVPNIVGKGKYEDRLRAAVDAEIVSEYNSMGKGKAAQHADPTKLYDWPTIEGIASESKTAADNVFGEYKKGPALKKGVNIFDAWADKVAQLTAGGKAKEDASAAWRVQKILSGDDAVKALGREHGAIQSRAAEKAIVDKIKADMITKYRAELIETHKGWPGYADAGKIFIQIFKAATAGGRRHDMWRFYQTFIHEYIHTLEHPDHVTYRKALDQQKGGFTLREGTTDYFTKIVWNRITIDDALRKKIEGPFHDPDPANKFPVQPLNTYGESENAERLAGVVGIRNVAAAFFLGKVELIGKK